MILGGRDGVVLDWFYLGRALGTFEFPVEGVWLRYSAYHLSHLFLISGLFVFSSLSYMRCIILRIGQRTSRYKFQPVSRSGVEAFSELFLTAMYFY